jgi:hypothetical protein
MTTSSREDDDRLLEELRAALRAAGPPTPAMKAAGGAAFSWRTVDAELAQLDDEPPPAPVNDSSREDYALARDGDDGPSVLRFTAPSASVELQESDDGWAGMLEPAADGEVTVLGPDGTALETAPIDELGTFFIARAASGPVRLRCRTAASELLTDWCLLR